MSTSQTISQPQPSSAEEPQTATSPDAASEPAPENTKNQTPQNLLGQQAELGFMWPTIDPFLFLAHHRDEYPNGDGSLAPAASLSGREIGADFSRKDGWSMYHGDHVPGFPRHPHRGFETITYVREGFIDHSDSMGATARFGEGDTQWMTAGGGVEHCEMFPLVRTDSGNPTELFQIWLNLPARSKMVAPYFTMMWSEQTPVVVHRDAAGNQSEVVVLAGTYGGRTGATPPPDSWASAEDSDLALWHLKLDPNASVELPASVFGGAHDRPTQRVLYLFGGGDATVTETPSAGRSEILVANHGAAVDATATVTLTAGPEGAEVLVMQGRPIGEPVVKHGPFVMNTSEEIRQAMVDYHRGLFGRWPWATDDPAHAADQVRFAQRPGQGQEFPPQGTLE